VWLRISSKETYFALQKGRGKKAGGERKKEEEKNGLRKTSTLIVNAGGNGTKADLETDGVF